jgi:two-component system chemotaxis sensor kinase CheA
MIRNVCDHGIETPEERRAKGAAETGNLWMSCELTTERVILTVRDDGRGIDPTRLRSKSVEKGVLTPEQAEALRKSGIRLGQGYLYGRPSAPGEFLSKLSQEL